MTSRPPRAHAPSPTSRVRALLPGSAACKWPPRRQHHSPQQDPATLAPFSALATIATPNAIQRDPASGASRCSSSPSVTAAAPTARLTLCTARSALIPQQPLVHVSRRAQATPGNPDPQLLQTGGRAGRPRGKSSPVPARSGGP